MFGIKCDFSSKSSEGLEQTLKYRHSICDDELATTGPLLDVEIIYLLIQTVKNDDDDIFLYCEPVPSNKQAREVMNTLLYIDIKNTKCLAVSSSYRGSTAYSEIGYNLHKLGVKIILAVFIIKMYKHPIMTK